MTLNTRYPSYNICYIYYTCFIVKSVVRKKRRKKILVHFRTNRTKNICFVNIGQLQKSNK